jgi:hypothetical protein
VLSPIAALLLVGQVTLPGTQPNTLANPVEISEVCGCHSNFDNNTMTEPGQSYRATLMANSARDPLFRAAFTIARTDRPNLSDLCLRCHAPTGWLQGRSEGSLAELFEEDMQSVTCDLCHRMVPNDPPLVGSGQYTISPEITKRSQRGMGPPAGHPAVQSDFTASSELCAPCHSLFNPAEMAYGPEAEALGHLYYEQRTYEEWNDSAFKTRGESCISCHMEKVRGAAVRGGGTYDDLHVHGIVGGNTFAPQAIRHLNPTLPIVAETDQVVEWARRSLRRAGEITIGMPRIDAVEGSEYGVPVRLTNKTGHKLPTGYPEGRRVYLEVSLILDGQPPQVLSGSWNRNTGMLDADPQLRTYETKHGRVENGVSERTHHLILMNQILLDTRIPPEGFRPETEDMAPIGRSYGDNEPYRHWDDVTYRFTAPEVTTEQRGWLRVRAMYQVVDGEVFRFLTETTAGSPESNALIESYEALGRAPPEEITTASVAISFVPRSIASVDSGVEQPPPMGADEGCGCRDVEREDARVGLGLALLALFSVRRRAR